MYVLYDPRVTVNSMHITHIATTTITPHRSPPLSELCDVKGGRRALWVLGRLVLYSSTVITMLLYNANVNAAKLFFVCGLSGHRNYNM